MNKNFEGLPKKYRITDVDQLDGHYAVLGIPMKSVYHGDPFVEIGFAFDNGYKPLIQVPGYKHSFLDLDGFSGSALIRKRSKSTH